MTTIILVRHAAHAHVGHTLSGRQAALPLTEAGEVQARALAMRLSRTELVAVHSSPLLRAQQTARTIVAGRDLGVETVEALTEIDFGDWTGKRFDELEGDPVWGRWNEQRGQASVPGGETMLAAQARAMAHVRSTARMYDGGTLLMVSHCDIIRAVLCEVLGLMLGQPVALRYQSRFHERDRGWQLGHARVEDERSRFLMADPAAVMPSKLAAEIEALGPWFHNMELDGIWTAPSHFLGDYPARKFRKFADAVPNDLTGRTVLDIGCNAGFYSLEMKRRGAAHVLGIDSDERYLSQARLAARVRGMQGIEFTNMSVYDVGALGRRFDLVIFMGVLYHLRHPLLALDLIREHVAGDMLVFQSMQRGSRDVMTLEEDYPFEETGIFDQSAYPHMSFVEREYAHDWTNWWVPNRACTEAMLRAAGFRIEQHPEAEVYICRATDVPYAAMGPASVYPARSPAGESKP